MFEMKDTQFSMATNILRGRKCIDKGHCGQKPLNIHHIDEYKPGLNYNNTKGPVKQSAFWFWRVPFTIVVNLLFIFSFSLSGHK